MLKLVDLGSSAFGSGCTALFCVTHLSTERVAVTHPRVGAKDPHGEPKSFRDRGRLDVRPPLVVLSHGVHVGVIVDAPFVGFYEEGDEILRASLRGERAAEGVRRTRADGHAEKRKALRGAPMKKNSRRVVSRRRVGR